MGMGIMLGAILVVVLGIGVLWFAMAGKTSGSTNTPSANTNNPTINVTTPDIKVPDTITINTPNNPPANAPAP